MDILKDLTFQNLKQYPETKEASVSILLRAIDSLQGLKNSAQLAAEEREKRGKKMREKEEIKGEEQEENGRVESDKEERKNEIEAEETKLEKEEKKERRKKLPKMESVLCLNHFSVVPICRMSQEKKSLFLQNEWLPFLSRLRLELMQIQTRFVSFFFFFGFLFLFSLSSQFSCRCKATHLASPKTNPFTG